MSFILLFLSIQLCYLVNNLYCTECHEIIEVKVDRRARERQNERGGGVKTGKKRDIDSRERE